MPYIKPTQTQSGWKKTTPPQVQKKDEEKGQTIELLAKFLFITESINPKTGQPMEGETKDGKIWKQWDVAFNVEGKQQNKIFKVFNDLSGKSLRLNDLVSGEDYKLLYEQGVAQVKANRLFWIGKPLGEPKKPVFSPNKAKTVYIPPVQNNGAKQTINKPQVAPEYKQLWDNNNFASYEEWMKIAEESGLFDREEDADYIFEVLIQQ